MGCSQLLLRTDLAPKTGVKRTGPLVTMCILGDEMHFESSYFLFRMMEFQGDLRVRLAPSLACKMIINCEWDPIYTVLEWVRATEEERKCLWKGEGWVREANPQSGG